jgi:hypothetical protein
VGNDVGGRPARKNAKIPEVVKVNNYQNCKVFTVQKGLEKCKKNTRLKKDQYVNSSLFDVGWFHSRFKLVHSCQKTPIYTRTS